MALIVVGFDGSPAAEAALTIALEEATLRKLPLRIVCGWEIPPMQSTGSAFAASPDLVEAAEAHARAMLEQAMAKVGTNPAVHVEAVAVQGHPATVLADQSAEASLLVVGSRRRGAVKSIVLGSVSQAVLHHCSCPLLIVPAPA